MSRSENRHYTAKWKKKKHPASKCSVPKCPVCHPNKYIGGNNKSAIKPKYRLTLKTLIQRWLAE